MSTFEGKVAVITGAGSGIGRALAVNLAAKGAKLALSDIDAEGLADTVRQAEALGAQVKSDHLNVAERTVVLEYADTVAAHFGAVHQVYNNAGIAYNGDVENTEFKDIERIIDVDFWGVVNGTKAFLPHVIASGDGHVIAIRSHATDADADSSCRRCVHRSEPIRHCRLRKVHRPGPDMGRYRS